MSEGPALLPVVFIIRTSQALLDHMLSYVLIVFLARASKVLLPLPNCQFSEEDTEPGHMSPHFPKPFLPIAFTFHQTRLARAGVDMPVLRCMWTQ